MSEALLDSYLVSTDYHLLSSFCLDYSNVIGPMPGRAGSPELCFDDGVVVQAQTAVGECDKYYACIRADQTPDLCDGVFFCEVDDAISVLGVWS